MTDSWLGRRTNTVALHPRTIHKGRPHGGGEGGLRNIKILRTNSTDRLREMWTRGRGESQKSPKFCGRHMYMVPKKKNYALAPSLKPHAFDTAAAKCCHVAESPPSEPPSAGCPFRTVTASVDGILEMIWRSSACDVFE